MPLCSLARKEFHLSKEQWDVSRLMFRKSITWEDRAAKGHFAVDFSLRISWPRFCQVLLTGTGLVCASLRYSMCLKRPSFFCNVCFYYTWCAAWLLTLYSESGDVLVDVSRSILFSKWSILFSKWLIGHQSLSEEALRNPEVSWCSS